MRLLVATLLIPLSFSMAFADAPVARAAPAVSPAPKLVGVILSTSQALLWDAARGEYVIKRVGETIDGAHIVALERDRLVLDRNGARETLALSAAPTTHTEHPRRMPAVIVDAPTAPAPQAPAAAPPATTLASQSAPAATVASPVVASAAPASPMASAAPSPTVEPPPVVATPAPVAPSAPVAAVAPPAVAATPAPVAAPAPVVAAAAPVAAAPAPVATPAPVAAPPAPVAPPPGAIAAPYAPPAMPAFPTPPPSVAQGPILIIPRNVVDRELGDFTALASEVTVSPGVRGGFRLANLRAGSFLERIGLRSGDTVLRVDGRPINAVEDASAAYAWLRVTDHFTVDLVRDGRPVQLRYVIAGPQTASN